MNYAISKSEFLTDISDHEMTVLRNDGVYRHLRFKKPGSSDMYFDIVTWPGHLAYTGDMGSYLFSRVPDMFTFFREEQFSLRINPCYWSEKVLSADRDGIKEFSWKLFLSNLKERCETPEQLIYLGEQLEYVEEHEIGSYEFIRNFDNDNDANLYLHDFWEVENKEYTRRFIWCCYALVWGINKFDQLTEAAA